MCVWMCHILSQLKYKIQVKQQHQKQQLIKVYICYVFFSLFWLLVLCVVGTDVCSFVIFPVFTTVIFELCFITDLPLLQQHAVCFISMYVLVCLLNMAASWFCYSRLPLFFIYLSIVYYVLDICCLVVKCQLIEFYFVLVDLPLNYNYENLFSFQLIYCLCLK